MQVYRAVKDAFQQYIPEEEELEAFASWAFGEDYKSLVHAMKFLERWNSLHQELVLTSDGHVSEDVPKMVELWRKTLA